MDWPHDPDGEEGSEGGRKYGLAIIAKKLDDDALPVTRDECLEEFGDHPIRIDHEEVIAASEVLDAMDPGPFEEREEFLGAAGRAMRAGGYWSLESERYQ